MDDEKRCYKCNTSKPAGDFYKNAARKDGLDTLCRECRKVAVKAYRQTPAGKKMQRGVARRFAEKNPKWWDKYNFTDESRAARAAWERSDAGRAFRRKQEAIRRSRWLGQWVEDVDRDAVWVRDGGVCRLCGLSADAQSWHLEHLTPISRGGLHEYANVAVSHPRCNLSKGPRTYAEWEARNKEVK